LVARDSADLSAVAKDLRQEPVVVAADLRRGDAPDFVARQVLDVTGRVDILVNNAGAAARLATTDTDGTVIDTLLAVNVRAPLLLIARLVPSMIQHGGGCIINLSSVSALIGTPRRAAYAASKGALDAATRSLAMELGPFGIRVNSVAPGVVDTDMWAKNKMIPGVVETIEGQTPLRRWAKPDDIADVIVFLASDFARFITGETIAVDGGMVHTLDIYGGPV
jgi:NAD(P)-dependent dehydrogenase (short-subunit alcohol dehydrogenase family)